MSNGKKDLVREVSSSRAYSLNLYLEPGVIVYSRKYKKILLLITEGLPMMLAVFSVFKKVAYIFKFAEEEKKMFELLFESLKEKRNNFKEKLLKKIKTEDKQKQPYANHNVNRILMSQNSNLNLELNSIKNLPKINEREKEEDNIIAKIKNNNFKTYSPNILPDESNVKIFTNIKNPRVDFKNFQNKKYEKMKLFPYRYYLCTSFIKNFDIKNLTNSFSKKFIKVYLLKCLIFHLILFYKKNFKY